MTSELLERLFAGTIGEDIAKVSLAPGIIFPQQYFVMIH
jgi:hypothetical protein